MSLRWYKLFEDMDAAKAAIADRSIRRATVDGIKVSIARYRNQLYAVNDQCPHRKASLGGGQLNGYGEIICPLHHYRFGLSSGQEAENRCADLEVYKIDIREDGIYIGMYR